MKKEEKKDFALPCAGSDTSNSFDSPRAKTLRSSRINSDSSSKKSITTVAATSSNFYRIYQIEEKQQKFSISNRYDIPESEILNKLDNLDPSNTKKYKLSAKKTELRHLQALKTSLAGEVVKLQEKITAIDSEITRLKRISTEFFTWDSDFAKQQADWLEELKARYETLTQEIKKCMPLGGQINKLKADDIKNWASETETKLIDAWKADKNITKHRLYAPMRALGSLFGLNNCEEKTNIESLLDDIGVVARSN